MDSEMMMSMTALLVRRHDTANNHIGVEDTLHGY